MFINAIDPSQVHAPHIRVSFGDVHREVNRAKKAFNLTGSELQVLHAMISAITRKNYHSDMMELLEHKMKWFAEQCGMAVSNVSRAFKGLVAKGLVQTVAGQGKRIWHRFSIRFVDLVARKQVTSPVALALVDSGDKSMDSDQIDNKDVINPITTSDQIDNKDVINPITTSDQIDNIAPYIEDFPDSLASDSLPTVASSILPCPETVDEFSKALAPVVEGGLEVAKAWVTVRLLSETGRRFLPIFIAKDLKWIRRPLTRARLDGEYAKRVDREYDREERLAQSHAFEVI